MCYAAPLPPPPIPLQALATQQAQRLSVAYNNLAGILKMSSRLAECIQCYEHVVFLQVCTGGGGGGDQRDSQHCGYVRIRQISERFSEGVEVEAGCAAVCTLCLLPPLNLLPCPFHLPRCPLGPAAAARLPRSLCQPCVGPQGLRAARRGSGGLPLRAVAAPGEADGRHWHVAGLLHMGRIWEGYPPKPNIFPHPRQGAQHGSPPEVFVHTHAQPQCAACCPCRTSPRRLQTTCTRCSACASGPSAPRCLRGCRWAAGRGAGRAAQRGGGLPAASRGVLQPAGPAKCAWQVSTWQPSHLPCKPVNSLAHAPVLPAGRRDA